MLKNPVFNYVGRNVIFDKISKNNRYGRSKDLEAWAALPQGTVRVTLCLRPNSDQTLNW